MSTAATLILIQQYMTRYLLSTILTVGTLGNLLAIVVFSKKNSRKNSCSIYLAAISIFGSIATWWAIPPLINALDHFDMVSYSLVLCRIRGYTIHASSMCFRYTLVLLCIDRYASCHPRATIRALCRPQIAYRSINILVIFWLVGSSHLLIWESIENNRCGVYGLYGQIYSFYNLVFVGIIPILSMILLSIPLMKNLRQIRSRVHIQGAGRQLQRRDVKLMKIVLVEMVVYMLCSIGHPLMLIYLNIINNLGIPKSTEQRQIESFMNFITMSLLLYLSYNTPFYVHFFTSKTYRDEIKQSIMELFNERRTIKRNNVRIKPILSLVMEAKQ